MKKSTKIIATILVVYSLLAGMLVPISAGIYSVTPRSVEAGGEVELQVTAYNTTFVEESAIFVRLRLSPDSAICATAIKVDSTKVLTISFDLPSQLPIIEDEEVAKSFPFLEIENKADGSYATLETALFIKPSPDSVNKVVPYCEMQLMESSNTTYPYLNILQETIRNLFFHVPMWFGMLLIMFMSVLYSVRYLAKPQDNMLDIKANAFASVGLLFGIVGITTGALWAKHTWGAYWSFDVKQNTSAVALLIYMAYFVLRSSFDDTDKRARVAAVYNIFAFATLIPLLYIVPRMVDSLHPGATGNPGFNTYDLDSTMRMVFYPAVIGWIMMGFWIADLKIRIDRIQYKMLGDLD